MDAQTIILLCANGVVGLLAWSLKSKHDDAMERLKNSEEQLKATGDRLTKLETKSDAVADSLKEIKEDIRKIRERLEDR